MLWYIKVMQDFWYQQFLSLFAGGARAWDSGVGEGDLWFVFRAWALGLEELKAQGPNYRAVKGLGFRVRI